MLSHSVELLVDAVEQINALPDIDFVVFTGDLVDASDAKRYPQFARVANTLNVPWYWTPGNHDLALTGLKRAQFLSMMNKLDPYIKPLSTCYSFSVNGFLFFSMDGASDSQTTSHGLFSDECLSVLSRQTSSQPEMPAVIFQHFPLIYPWTSESHSVTNQKQYLSLIASHPNIKAVFSGHFHAVRIKTVNNVLHVSSPSLIEYPNAFRVVTVKKTRSGVVFDITTVETRLKSVQEESKRKSPAALNAGKPSDWNARVTIH